MWSAVARLSPVSSTTSMPSACICSMAGRLEVLTTSDTPMTPAAWPASPKNSGVTPSASMRSAAIARSSGMSQLSSTKARLPPRSSLPASFPRRPLPGTASKFVRLE